MKFIFTVQGEGRGHMTQAIALQNMLLKNGHEICCVVVGKSERRIIPDFFHKSIKCPIIALESPNFVTKNDNKGIDIAQTLYQNFKKFFFYWGNVKKLSNIIKQHKPDAVINFYEFLCGVYFLTHSTRVRHISIGHQFLLQHSAFQFPKGINAVEKWLYFLNTAITSAKCTQKFALSFKEYAKEKNIVVLPPLLRQEVLDLTPTQQNYLLVYVVNAGFCDEIISWHAKNPHVQVHLFTDRAEWDDETVFNRTLTVHKLNDKKFLSLMQNCMAYASTAGFESICEAMYLGKPVLLVPPQGHFEQQCNAYDAVQSEAGISSTFFDLSALLALCNQPRSGTYSTFRYWVHSAEQRYLSYIETHADRAM